MAVDKQQLANEVLKGAVEAVDTIVPPGMPGYNFNIQKLAYSPSAAQQALTDAVYSGGKTLPSVTLIINEQDTSQSLTGVFLQNAWHTNLGLNVALDVEPLDQFNSKLTALANSPQTSTIQMYLSTWGADYPDQ